MERIHAINPNRIMWCCNDRGITVDSLANEIGFSQSTMTKLMRGEGGITFNQLRKLANYFNRGTLFFLEKSEVQDERIHTEQYRTIANQKPEIDANIKALIERVEKQREIFLSLREDLGESNRKFFVEPKITNVQPLQAAAIVRDWLDLKEKNNFDSYRHAIEQKGILVFRSNGYAGKWQISKKSSISGFSIYDARCPVIVVKKQQFESRQVFTLMHELGHLLLHRNSFLDEEADLNAYEGREHDANDFAGQVLVPNMFLERIDDHIRPTDASGYDDWLKKYRNAWGVSTDVILRRLRDTGRLGKKEYDRFCDLRSKFEITEDEGGNRKFRYREPSHVFGETFVSTVLDALSAHHISLVKASTYLDNLKIKDMHQLERYYAGV